MGFHGTVQPVLCRGVGWVRDMREWKKGVVPYKGLHRTVLLIPSVTMGVLYVTRDFDGELGLDSCLGHPVALWYECLTSNWEFLVTVPSWVPHFFRNLVSFSLP